MEYLFILAMFTVIHTSPDQPTQAMHSTQNVVASVVDGKVVLRGVETAEPTAIVITEPHTVHIAHGVGGDVLPGQALSSYCPACR